MQSVYLDGRKGDEIPRYILAQIAGPRGAVGNASDSRARGPGFDIRSGHILLFLPKGSCQLLAKVCA